MTELVGTLSAVELVGVIHVYRRRGEPRPTYGAHYMPSDPNGLRLLLESDHSTIGSPLLKIADQIASDERGRAALAEVP